MNNMASARHFINDDS